jgi:hypothetical protein
LIGSAGGGSSRTASARLDGMAGVMFFMVAPSPVRVGPQRTAA